MVTYRASLTTIQEFHNKTKSKRANNSNHNLNKVKKNKATKSNQKTKSEDFFLLAGQSSGGDDGLSEN